MLPEIKKNIEVIRITGINFLNKSCFKLGQVSSKFAAAIKTVKLAENLLQLKTVQGARLAEFIKRRTIRCYTQNIKPLGFVVF